MMNLKKKELNKKMKSDELSVLVRRVSSNKIVVEEDSELFGVTIPKGFESDGVTSPHSLFHIFLSPFSEGLYAALVHDYVLHIGEKNMKTRKKADNEFYNNLKASGVSNSKASLAYMCVRIWSWYVLVLRK